MWRWIFFLIALCFIVVGVVWFVQNPGDVTIEWRGRRIDTSVGVLMLLIAAFAAIIAIAYRMWRAIRRTPGEISAVMARRKQRKGYTALSSGMVAVAAGDAGEARRHARRAEQLLKDDTALTRLLSAQSAQLDGDEKAAEAFFTEMLNDSETRFLGLRGLLTQALKADDRDKALALAKQCYAMRPKSEWVAHTLFDLQTGATNWIEAQHTADDMQRNRLLERPAADRHRAVMALEQSRDEGNVAAAKLLKRAVSLAPTLVPAVLALVERQLDMGHHRKAASLIERTWLSMPHPDLVEPYMSAKKTDTALTRVKATEKLVAGNRNHLESKLVLARAALDAELWGEARKHLAAAGAGEGPEPQARVCRMMAELEEREHSDLIKAREWLVRAASAPADPTWVCRECGNTVEVWTSHCPNCETFDSFSWDQPRHVQAEALSAPDDEDEDAESTAMIEQKASSSTALVKKDETTPAAT